MQNGRIAPPGYVLPNRPRWQGGWNLRWLFGSFLAFTLVAIAAKEWLAIRLHKQLKWRSRSSGLPALRPASPLLRG